MHLLTPTTNIQPQHQYTMAQNKHKKLKPGLMASYTSGPKTEQALFL